MAEAVGCSLRFVKGAELGEKTIRISFLEAVAGVFKCSVHDIFVDANL